ncbi:MAG: enoyl-CoA hydratase-related protein, partial [Paracoccaceae bacterium]
VRQERFGDVLVLVLAHPPVNTLSQGVRQGLVDGLAAAESADDIRAIVIRGEGRGFSAGADIKEFGKVSQTVGLSEVCRRIEACTKPVIAALHGVALGGGLEIALAAHYRIANALTMLGLPEVNLGLLPGAGGTQRLPRLIGAKEALRIMLSGAPIRASEGIALGMIDRVVEVDLTEAAILMAREGLSPRRTGTVMRGSKDVAGNLAAIRAARAGQKGNHLPAPMRIIDCIEAAGLLPLDQGLKLERTAFEDLVATPEAAGLRYAFFTERRAATPPLAVAAVGVPQINSVGIWGADDTAADLAFQALSAGMRVALAAPQRAALVGALERIAGRQEQAVVAGQMSEDARDADWARLSSTLSPEPLAGSELLVLAAGVEPLPEIFDIVMQAAIGAAEAEGGPDVAVTVPYAVGGLAEVSMSGAAVPAVVARVMALVQRLNWRMVFAGPGGPIELHLRQALAGAVAQLEADGTSQEVVTAALAAYGMASGPQDTLPPMPSGGAAVVASCLAALAAEGARMLDARRARRAVDIDAVALFSGLMPRWQGGPMFQADQRGLLVLRADLRGRAAGNPLFKPAGLIDRLIADGKDFASLNSR